MATDGDGGGKPGYEVAWDLLEEGYLDAALVAAEAALAAEPDSPEAHYVLGMLDRDAGDRESAVAHFQAAAAYSAWLMRNRGAGIPMIRNILRDDIRTAMTSGNHAHAAELIAALRHFLAEHPQNPEKPR